MITTILTMIVLGISYVLWHYAKRKREEEEAAFFTETAGTETVEQESQKDETVHSERSQKDVVLEALRALQCEPKIANDEKDPEVFHVTYEYQSEMFQMRVDNRSPYVTLYDITWYSFDAEDIDMLGYAKRVINDINWQSTVNVCYTMSDDGAHYNLHTACHIYCGEGVDFKEYLRHLMRECFVVHNTFYAHQGSPN